MRCPRSTRRRSSNPGAVIADDVTIGPYCLVGPEVELGAGVELLSHVVVVTGITTIGARTRIFPFASIGHEPQDKKYRGERSRLIIGAENVIRESVSMSPGTTDGGMVTRIGDRNLFMLGTHVAHDCIVGNDCVFANNATLAGHVVVGDFAILGGLSAVHQFCRIGHHAMVGGVTGVERDVIPYGMAIGDRARLVGLNLVGLQRSGYGKDDIQALRAAYDQLFGSDGTLQERIDQIAIQYAAVVPVMELVDFVRAPIEPPARASPIRGMPTRLGILAGRRIAAGEADRAMPADRAGGLRPRLRWPDRPGAGRGRAPCLDAARRRRQRHRRSCKQAGCQRTRHRRRDAAALGRGAAARLAGRQIPGPRRPARPGR